MRMDDVLALLERDDMGDQEMVDYLRSALQESGGSRPSIETLLHGFLPAQAVIHTCADAVVSLANNDQAEQVLREVYGDIVAALHYRRPGFRISREVADLLRPLRPSAEYGRPETNQSCRRDSDCRRRLHWWPPLGTGRTGTYRTGHFCPARPSPSGRPAMLPLAGISIQSDGSH